MYFVVRERSPRGIDRSKNEGKDLKRHSKFIVEILFRRRSHSLSLFPFSNRKWYPFNNLTIALKNQKKTGFEVQVLVKWICFDILHSIDNGGYPSVLLCFFCFLFFDLSS